MHPARRRDDRAFLGLVTAMLLFAPVAVVVASATTYVWISGFEASASTPARSIALFSAGVVSEDGKTYSVFSASEGLRYEEMAFTVDGVGHLLSDLRGACASDPGRVVACRNGEVVEPSSTVLAGDTLTFTGVETGQTIRVLDRVSNNVLLTLTIG